MINGHAPRVGWNEATKNTFQEDMDGLVQKILSKERILSKNI